MKIMWEWEPNVRLGPIVFGESIEIYINSLNAYLDEEEGSSSIDWLSYKLPNDEIYIHVENNKVVSVVSHCEFIYKNKNLIDINIIELNAILGCVAKEVGEDIFFDDGDVQTPYDYDDLGLEVWVSKQKIESISCLTYEGCED